MKRILNLCIVLLAVFFFTIPGESAERKDGKNQRAVFDSLIHHSREYVYAPDDSGIYLANQAIRFARTQSNRGLVAEALFNKGYIFYRWNNLDSAEIYLNRSLKFNRELGDSTGVGIAINRLGNVYWLQDKQILAKQYFEKAKSIHKQKGNHKELGRAINNLANLYREWGDYQKAIQFYLEAKEHYQQANYIEGVAWLNFSLAVLYRKLDDFPRALEAVTASLEEYRKITSVNDDSAGIMICYGQLGDIYNQMDQPEKGLKYYFRSLRMRKQTGVKPAIADDYSRIGQSYYQLGEYQKALEFFLRSQAVRKESNTNRGAGISMKYIGLIHYKMGRTDEAIKYLADALKIARQLNERKTVSEILKETANVYAETGNYEQAWMLFQSHRTVQDSLMNAQISKRITSIQLQQEIDRQKTENERLQRENQIKDLQLARGKILRALFVMLSLLVLGGVGVTIYIYRKKLQIKTLRGLIPICSHCKKIRNDQGYYEQLEEYISTHSDAQFSHGICNDCLEEHYPEFSKKKELEVVS